jgi:hypothetical protein
MASISRQAREFSGCHPELTPKSSPPGALSGWQLFDLSPAISYHLLLHHYVRLRRFMRLQHYLRLEKEARRYTERAQGRDTSSDGVTRIPAAARRT